MEYDDLVLYCEIRWLSNGQLLVRFWKLKNVVGDFLEEKVELPEIRSLLCTEKWLLNFAFLLDIIVHFNDLNSKLQGKDKLFPSLVKNVIAFRRKLKLFVAQLQNKELSKFPYLRQQSECAEANVNFTEYIKKSCYCSSLLMVVLVIFLKKTAFLHFYIHFHLLSIAF